MAVTAGSLTAIATGLRATETALRGVEEQLGSMLTTAESTMSDLGSLWGGPRATAVLGAGGGYASRVGGGRWGAGAAGMVGAVCGTLGRWASAAEGASDQLRGPERVLSGWIDIPDSPGNTEQYQQATDTIAAVRAEWTRTCTSYASELDTYRPGLESSLADVAFAPSFPYPVLVGSEYSGVVYRFCLNQAVPLSIIDPTGTLLAESDARLDGLFSTDTGTLLFTVIETAHEEDLGEADEHWSLDDLVAASDPAVVERHLRQIYADAGEPIDDARLDFLVNETVTTALALRASGNDDWKDRDEDLGYFEHGFGEWLREDFAGPATAFVATAGCAVVVTTASGGTLAAPAAGACAAFGGAAGDFVDTVANGGGVLDGLENAANPQRRLIDGAIGFTTQGLFNHFLPAPTAVPGAVSSASDDLVVSAPDNVLFSTSGTRTNADLIANGGGLPRTAETISELAERGGIGLDGVRVQVLEGADDIRYLDANGAVAFASDGTIYLGPAAFADETTLVRTLGHERTHIWQQTIYTPGSANIQALENAAYAAEDTFVWYLQGGG